MYFCYQDFLSGSTNLRFPLEALQEGKILIRGNQLIKYGNLYQIFDCMASVFIKDKNQ